MSSKQIVMLVVSVVVIIGCAIWIYAQYRKWNPRPEPIPAGQMYQPYPHPPGQQGQ